VDFVRKGRPVGSLDGYAAPLVATEARASRRSGRDESKPFFMLVCFLEPHEPIASARQFTDP
jgi:arylsulfatase A